MTDRTPMTIRLPADLRDTLRSLARADERSMQSLIVFALRRYVEQVATVPRADHR